MSSASGDRVPGVEPVHQSMGSVRVARRGHGRVLVPRAGSRVNVALRAVHEALASSGEPADRWRSFVAELSGPGGPHGHPQVSEVGTALRTAGVGGSASGWLGHLRLLGVIAPDGRLDDRRADEVATALELV